jgi:Arc-like DNA binding dprotein
MAKSRAEREYELYKDPEYQRPQGPARKRAKKFTDIVPVRFPGEVLDEVRRRAEADDRSVSSWIRRAVDRELKRGRPARGGPKAS